jgi:putative SOS response-associated peptidase YedK
MLTVNADDHSLMKRFHKPGDEKRSVVIVRPDVYADWLGCRSTDEARSFLNLYPVDEMAAVPYPLPPRKTAPKSDDDLLTDA